jgi:hypothetical protein
MFLVPSLCVFFSMEPLCASLDTSACLCVRALVKTVLHSLAVYRAIAPDFVPVVTRAAWHWRSGHPLWMVICDIVSIVLQVLSSS